MLAFFRAEITVDRFGIPSHEYVCPAVRSVKLATTKYFGTKKKDELLMMVMMMIVHGTDCNIILDYR